MTSTNDRYYAGYDGLQKGKHELLRKYLGGWFPILSAWNGRVLYVDCHAGRGRHDTGDEGSPILALRLLLEHKRRPQILSTTKVHFLLFELDPQNFECLQAEISSLGELPSNVVVTPVHADYAGELRSIIGQLRSSGSQLAPAFAFVDPYGFTLSMELLNDLLSFEKCELLINFMYRHIDMAMTHAEQAANMDGLFGCQEWRQLPSIADSHCRSDETIRLFSKQLRARYVTHLRCRADNGGLKYVLIHATNHVKGRNLMKSALWSLTPDGSFSVSERDCPGQPVLITADPDLRLLKSALWSEFAGRSVRVERLQEWLVPLTFLEKHLHQIISDYRNRDIIVATGYEGRFSFSRNPLITFPAVTPAEE